MASWFGGSARPTATQPVLGQTPLPLGSSSHIARAAPTQPTLRPAPASGTTPLLASQPTLVDLARATGARSGAFVAGEDVEYFSGTHGKWIPAKVLASNANGTYSLDCKPDVPAEKVRKAQAPPSRAATAFAAGDIVEYYSATQGKWIPAKVLKVKSSGVYDLDCKPDVPSDKVRARYRIGAAVEYFSATQNSWIPAKVLGLNANGTYNLDCKPDVTPDKIRQPEQQNQDVKPAAKVGFAEGDAVEYYSATHQKWIPAKVISVNTTGTYDLDCKPDVPADKIRGVSDRASLGSAAVVPAADSAAASAPGFAAGDAVEYLSATANKWIPAKVVSANKDGTFDVDCKPGVTKDRLRRPAAAAAERSAGAAPAPAAAPAAVATRARELPGAGAAAGGSFKVGDKVEYFGATQNKWVPTKVVKVSANGTYDLECKIMVSPDKIRTPAAAPAVPDSSPVTRAVGDMAEYFGAALGRLGGGAGGWFGTTGASSGRLAPAPGLDKPVQLLSMRRGAGVNGGWRYEVAPEGAAALERLGSRRVAVASICGPRRTGKTVLMDALQGTSQRGARGGSTAGLWLTASVEEGDEEGPVLAFLDCEGFGGKEDDDQARDAQLLALCSLLSSALLLNTPDGELDDTALASLAPACRFCEGVEERGNEANRPVLLWVLRDVVRQLQDAQGRPLSADDYLEKSLHAPAQAGEQGQAAREARRGLLHFFKHRSCATLPPPTKTGDFRAAVDSLRREVVSTCLANPKAVAGQPLSCFSLAQLLRQLTTAANDGRILNIKAAWETVQHTSCGALADELREAASSMLRELAAGRQVPGGAKLPLTDDELNAVLRDQRHTLKAQWEERAIGDEAVRREYWQELKEALAREEGLVRAQNARLADQRGVEALRAWQDWLDDDGEGATKAAEEICRQLGGAMERLPSRPLSRVGRAAVQAAARRVAAARGAVRDSASRHEELQRKAVSLGERAAQQEGAARSELDKTKTELAEAQDQVAAREKESTRLREETGARLEELKEAEAQLRAALVDLDAAKAREREQGARHRAQVNTLESLQNELEQVRAAAARDDAQRLAAERLAEAAAENASSQRNRLEEELTKARVDAARCADLLASEKSAHQDRLMKVRDEHQQKVEGAHRHLAQERETLQGQHSQLRAEHQKKVEDAHQKVEEQRKAHSSALDEHRGRLLERERQNGVLEGKLHALGSEAEVLRSRVKDLEEQVRKAEVLAEQRRQENGQLERDLQGAKATATQHREAAEWRAAGGRTAEEEDEAERLRREAEEEADRRIKAKGCGISLRRLMGGRRAAAAGTAAAAVAGGA